MNLLQVGFSSPFELLAILFLFGVFVTWMLIKSQVDDEEKEAMDKLGKRKRIKRKIKKVKARIERKRKKGDKS